jgi:hypothetical protein
MAGMSSAAVIDYRLIGIIEKIRRAVFFELAKFRRKAKIGPRRRVWLPNHAAAGCICSATGSSIR